MKILIISPGKRHDHTVAEGIAEYEARLAKRCKVEWAFPQAGSQAAEAASMLKLLKDEDHVVLLDERGEEVTTEEVTALLDRRLQSGTKRLVFIIGGAYGVGDAVKERANLTLSLSRLVFPHMLVRLILVEQLYRAFSVREGGKYHHG